LKIIVHSNGTEIKHPIRPARCRFPEFHLAGNIWIVKLFPAGGKANRNAAARFPLGQMLFFSQRALTRSMPIIKQDAGRGWIGIHGGQHGQ